VLDIINYYIVMTKLMEFHGLFFKENTGFLHCCYKYSQIKFQCSKVYYYLTANCGNG